MERFYQDVEAIYARQGKCLIAVSEGIHDASGKLIAEYGAADGAVDAFGHKQLGGLAATLAQLLKARIGSKVRGIEFSLMQRCAAHVASQRDIDESFGAGKAAVEYATQGISDKMVGFGRGVGPDGGYQCEIKLMDLSDVANTEKKVPLEWINEAGNGLNAPFIDYALPLIQGEPARRLQDGLPRFAKLKKIQAQA
jgi:6-phosphofructokinase 1